MSLYKDDNDCERMYLSDTWYVGKPKKKTG